MACTDDKKARTVAKSIVGADRVIGSIGLLKQAVTCGLLSPDEAYMAYKKMVAAGGFLPEIQLDYFQ
jgi:predicted nucleic acid-binding protein